VSWCLAGCLKGVLGGVGLGDLLEYLGGLRLAHDLLQERGRLQDHEVFSDPARWHGLAPDALVEAAVREMAAIFGRHRDFLRAVILISGVHPQVNRRGSVYSRELGDRFARRCGPSGAGSARRVPTPAPPCGPASPRCSPLLSSASPRGPALPLRQWTTTPTPPSWPG
jgi:hypothetical protein